VGAIFSIFCVVQGLLKLVIFQTFVLVSGFRLPILSIVVKYHPISGKHRGWGLSSLLLFGYRPGFRKQQRLWGSLRQPGMWMGLILAVLTLCACQSNPQTIRVQSSNGVLAEPLIPTEQAKTIFVSLKTQQAPSAVVLSPAFLKRLDKALQQKGYTRVPEPTNANYQLVLNLRYLGTQTSSQITQHLKQGTRGKVVDPLVLGGGAEHSEVKPQTNPNHPCLIVDLRLSQKVGEHWDYQKVGTPYSNRGITEISASKRVHWRQHQTRMVLMDSRILSGPTLGGASVSAMEKTLLTTVIGIF